MKHSIHWHPYMSGKCNCLEQDTFHSSHNCKMLDRWNSNRSITVYCNTVPHSRRNNCTCLVPRIFRARSSPCPWRAQYRSKWMATDIGFQCPCCGQRSDFHIWDSDNHHPCTRSHMHRHLVSHNIRDHYRLVHPYCCVQNKSGTGTDLHCIHLCSCTHRVLCICHERSKLLGHWM